MMEETHRSNMKDKDNNKDFIPIPSNKKNPLGTIFSKLEYPKYTEFWGGRNNMPIKSNNKEACYFLIFFLIILTLTYILPQNVLEIIVPLKYFVDVMTFIFSSVSALKKYSTFPEIAQLVYSICIVTMPIQIFLLHKIIKGKWSNEEKTLDELRISLCIFGFILILLIPYTLFFLPIIGFNSQNIFFRNFHISKIVFSIVLAIIFSANTYLISIIIVFNIQLRRIKLIKIRGGVI